MAMSVMVPSFGLHLTVERGPRRLPAAPYFAARAITATGFAALIRVVLYAFVVLVGGVRVGVGAPSAPE